MVLDGQLWFHDSLGTLWVHCAAVHTLSTLRDHPGHTQCTQGILCTLWEHSGHTLNTIWAHSGNTLGTLWIQSGRTLGTLWAHPGHTQGPWLIWSIVPSKQWESLTFSDNPKFYQLFLLSFCLKFRTSEIFLVVFFQSFCKWQNLPGCLEFCM